MYIGEINDIDDYDFEFPEQKNYQWPLTKNEYIQATSGQCATCQMKSSESWEKSGKKNMNQIDKTDINDISIFTKISTH